ncbi:hypothetical protein [Cohnella sp.]|uniref:hypothetical protein n=1 Tax=Cohnella sp. TaxID=1883426 RepID=UPI0035670018
MLAESGQRFAVGSPYPLVDLGLAAMGPEGGQLRMQVPAHVDPDDVFAGIAVTLP